MDPTRAAAVARAFALGPPEAPPVFVARGAMGELWRLETGEGRWAVKVLFDRTQQDAAVPRDLELQEAAAAAGIALPRPRLAEGRAVVDGVRVYDWVDLAPPLAAPIDRATAEEAGSVLGRLHAIALPPGRGETVDEWYVTTPTTAEWTALAHRATDAGATWAGRLRDRLDLLAELGHLVASARFDHIGDVILCHRDLTPSNVFRPAGGGPLVVLDWENTGPLSATAELAMGLASWATPDDTDPFLAGYRAGGGTATVTGRASFATNMATVANYLRVVATQALDDDGHRAYAEPILAGMLADGGGIDAAQGWTS